MRIGLIVGALIALCSSEPLLAQSSWLPIANPSAVIQEWETGQRVHITKAARSTLADQLLAQSGFTAQLPADTRRQLLSAFASKQNVQVGAVPGGSNGILAVTIDQTVYRLGPAQAGGADQLRAAFDPNKITLVLAKFPRVHISIEPVPPRDHTIKINGDLAEENEQGIYVVPYGSVEVRVERSGKTPCTWKAVLVSSETAPVKCVF